MTQVTRREMLGAGAVTAGLVGFSGARAFAATTAARAIRPFAHADVTLAPGPALDQAKATQAALMAMDEDALLRPFRERAGQPTPGKALGGWYDFTPRFDPPRDMRGFIPGHSLGQYISALARSHAGTKDAATAAKVQRLTAGLSAALTPDLFRDYPLPAYTYDKILIGAIDAHRYADVPEAKALIGKATDIAAPFLPDHALTRDEMRARPHLNEAFTWDESYTLPENLYLAWQITGDARYRTLARAHTYDKPYFDPLAAGQNALPGNHAYSHVNALASALAAYEIEGSEKHLRAARNGLGFVIDQSFATGGWGPDEAFVEPGKGLLGASLSRSHAGFETPCGCYGHFKVARGLICATGESHWGDSMERLLYNAALGSLPLRPNGSAFYYSDYNEVGTKRWFEYQCPCCSGTIGQMTADYGTNAFLRDGDGIYVNLYLPAQAHWDVKGSPVALSVSGDYPRSGNIRMSVTAERPSRFALRLRIPAWAGSGTQLSVNGKALAQPAAGRFAVIDRVWQNGDVIALQIDMPLRLEAVDAETKRRFALVNGPVALFQTGTQLVTFRRADLLAARAQADGSWIVGMDSGDARFQPFPAIEAGVPTRLYQFVAD